MSYISLPHPRPARGGSFALSGEGLVLRSANRLPAIRSVYREERRWPWQWDRGGVRRTQRRCPRRHKITVSSTSCPNVWGYLGRLVFPRSHSDKAPHSPPSTCSPWCGPHGAQRAGSFPLRAVGWATPGGASPGEPHWGWNARDGFTYMTGASPEQAGRCLGAALLPHDPPSWAAGSPPGGSRPREKGSGSWRAAKAQAQKRPRVASTTLSSWSEPVQASPGSREGRGALVLGESRPRPSVLWDSFPRNFHPRGWWLVLLAGFPPCQEGTPCCLPLLGAGEASGGMPPPTLPRARACAGGFPGGARYCRFLASAARSKTKSKWGLGE